MPQLEITVPFTRVNRNKQHYTKKTSAIGGEEEVLTMKVERCRKYINLVTHVTTRRIAYPHIEAVRVSLKLWKQHSTSNKFDSDRA